jgi:hypothetical protein
VLEYAFNVSDQRLFQLQMGASNALIPTLLRRMCCVMKQILPRMCRISLPRLLKSPNVHELAQLLQFGKARTLQEMQYKPTYLDG